MREPLAQRVMMRFGATMAQNNPCKGPMEGKRALATYKGRLADLRTIIVAIEAETASQEHAS